ncbi:MAG: PEP-CTERM sorting domain-containing protein [Armatimonadetes bacterium]|nr:PEP-CTERM sorting domain-containing protein [Armatimonadota bacterium]
MRIAYLIVLIAALSAGAANAAFLFDWTAVQPHKVQLLDPTGDQLTGTGSDITAVWWGANSHEYFRLDLDEQPTIPNHGDIYGVYVDADPLVAGGAANFIPTELSGEGIDFAVIVQFNNDFLSPRLYQWDDGGGTWVQVPGAVTMYRELGADYSLEWTFNQGYLPSVLDPAWHAVSFWGGVVAGPAPTTLDLTGEATTPEPTTLALLGLGLGGMYLRRRRRS